MRALCFALFTVSVLWHNPCDSGAVVLDTKNIDEQIAGSEFVMINFYADWCRFSNMLSPIWDEFADKAKKEFPEPGKVLVGKVDCDSQGSLGTRFHVTKYPTLKYMRNGIVAKKEYRGQRTVDAFVDFVRQQTEEVVKEYEDLNELKDMDSKKRYIIGFFESKESTEYSNFRKVAANLKDDCVFMAGFGNAVSAMHPAGQSIVAFRPNKARSNEDDETFKGSLLNYDEFSIFATDKCTPLVREITFENAEEFTEEGLPFLILFYNPGDNENIKKYSDLIQRELLDEKQNINFLIADGVKFAHPLHHLGKSKADLPLIAIDSFRHMYLFPDYADMETPGKLKAFLADLYSGKLHREFHYGPDKDSTSDTPQSEEGGSDGSSSEDPSENEVDTGADAGRDRDRRSAPQGGGAKRPQTPPPSQFKHLGPSENRYTLLEHDEF